MEINPTLSQYLKTRVLRKVIPLASLLLLATSVLGFYGVLRLSARSHESILQAYIPEVSTLTEIQDRAELNRALNSLANHSDSEVTLLKGDRVFAVSSDLDQLDRKMSLEEKTRGCFPVGDNTAVDLTQMKIRSIITHESKSLGNQKLYMMMETPLHSYSAPFFAIVVALIVLAAMLVFILIRISIQTSTKAMLPIQDVVKAIEQLALLNRKPDPRTVAPDSLHHHQILELDLISKSIDKARTTLIEAHEKLMQERANSILGRVFQEIVHDVTDISVRITQLSQSRKDPKQSVALLGMNQKELDKLLLTSIHDLLTTIDSGKELMNQGYQDFCTSDLRDTVLKTLSKNGITNESNLYLGKEVEIQLPEKPILIPHSKALISRALSNLLSNAVQRTHDKITISVSAFAKDLRIGVSDNGQGMTESEFISHTSGEGKSSNGNRRSLGMSIVKAIAKYHGGDLHLTKGSSNGAILELILARDFEIREVAS